MYPEGLATSHLDTSFLDYRLPLANTEMVPKLQVATACLSCSPLTFKFIKIIPCRVQITNLLIIPNYHLYINY
jgi:hypothetical protein